MTKFINNHEHFDHGYLGILRIKNEMYLISQVVDILINSTNSIEDYGRELETLDDVASVLNALKCNIDRKSPINGNGNGNGLKVTKYKLNKENILKQYQPG